MSLRKIISMQIFELHKEATVDLILDLEKIVEFCKKNYQRFINQDNKFVVVNSHNLTEFTCDST